MQQAPAPASPETSVAHEPHFEIAVNIVDEHHSIPLELSGAGRWEALMLSAALTSGTGRVIVFDEPATSLHPSLQRTLLREIEATPAQSLLITHSPFLVPSGSSEDLRRVIRVNRIGDRTTVHRLTRPVGSATPTATAAAAKLHQLIAGSSDVRGLLFARAVILLEGESDLGALEHWLADSSTADPTPDELNLVLSAVGGDSRFGSFTSYLDAFGIPWVIICDGPALSPSYTHSLYQQVMRAGQSVHPPDLKDFVALRSNWAKYGVYTLADDFADEIENLLELIDPDTWKTAKAKFPRSKVRAAREFAEQTAPPERVHQMYRQAIDFLGLAAAGN
jgi:AAA domain, putative AbiEii toxin, Type IV TA system